MAWTACVCLPSYRVLYRRNEGLPHVQPTDVYPLIPKEKDSVAYCTCPSDKTSRAILHRALAMHFFRVKFLKGGLAAWKAEVLSGRAIQRGLPARHRKVVPPKETSSINIARVVRERNVEYLARVSLTRHPIFCRRSRKYSFQLSGNAATRIARRTELTSSSPYLFVM